MLDKLARRGAPLALDELARELFALTVRPAPGLARRLVASALGLGEAGLPEPLDLRSLPRLAAGAAASLPLDRAEWIVVDLETTGFAAGTSAILEIGAVRVVGLRRVESFETLVDPEGAIPPRITALTGIDRRLVAGAPPLASAVGAFRRWAGAGAKPFVAHNASFDERFVRAALAAHALPGWDGPVVCTRKLARRLVPELGRYDLDSLCACFGIGNPARHRALGDAEATARALVELLAIARSDHGLVTVGDLLAFQAAPGGRPRGGRRRAAADGSRAPAGSRPRPGGPKPPR